jgi:hypothetical protein
MGLSGGDVLTGSSNTAVGQNAGLLLQGAAHENTFVGQGSGDVLTTGSDNTCIGFGADTDDATAINQSVIGHSTTGVADNSVTLGNGNVTKLYAASDGGAVISAGGLGIGLAAVAPTYVLHSVANSASPCAWFANDGNNVNREGVNIAVGTDDASGTNYALEIRDGDGTSQGTISFSSGTVTYGAFTANHDAELPEADNDDGYSYGTLVETTELFYKGMRDGTPFERGIRYKVQKSSSVYAKNVLGSYAGKHIRDDNLHQIYVLGDGHILCNGEKGNIAVGDGICTSSTNGQGMKADKMAMCIGIAQEAVTFSGSESKLVAVQYGLQQFTPWE